MYFDTSSRLIPLDSTPPPTFHSQTQSEDEPIPEFANLSIREDLMFVRSQLPVSQMSSFQSKGSGGADECPQDEIADALGYTQKSNSNSPQSSRIEIASLLLSSTSPKKLASLLANEVFAPKTRPKRAEVIMAEKILQAPGLRNDFYSNLVSWSRKSNKIAVGLGCQVYIWGIDNVVVPINFSQYDTVTAVSCHTSDYLLVATTNGTLLLVNMRENRVRHVMRNNGVCIYCFAWYSNLLFYAGDDSGQVTMFEIVDSRLVVRRMFKSQQQQICGLAINATKTQLAVGGNDNCCTIWDVDSTLHVSLRCMLPHDAAVKALAFCPWSSSLIATGGGSKDRRIRFWHANSGTLLREINTEGQITSLVWSVFKRQIVVTFGFGSKEMARVYSYPAMERLVEIVATSSNLRILSSSMGPDDLRMCVATSDSTIRIYKLWEVGQVLTSSAGGAYGSKLIEMNEGETTPTEGIILR